MNTEKYDDVVSACRFCFMCRHLDTVGNVTYQEADTPRGRALILDKVRIGKENLKNPDYIETMYRSALSAACRFHCVSHYDEAGLVLAARRDIVEAGLEPEKVKMLAAELKSDAGVKIEGDSGEVIYHVDSLTASKQPEIAEAFKHILDEAGISYRILTGDTGKALLTLGYEDAARLIAEKLCNAVAKSGCKTLVISCPASFDALKNDYPHLGAAFTPKTRILHSSEFMLELLENGKLKQKPKKMNKAYYLESDFLKRYNQLGDVQCKLLKKIGLAVVKFGTNSEESYAVGEGAVVYDRLQPEILKLLCSRIVGLADCPDTDVLVTASPYAKYALKTFSGKTLNLISIEEAVAARYSRRKSFRTRLSVKDCIA